MNHHIDYTIELEEILHVVRVFERRVQFIASQHGGNTVDQVNAALAQLGTDITALLARPQGITPAQAQTITDAINGFDAQIKAALGTSA